MKVHCRLGIALTFAPLVFLITQTLPPGHLAIGQGVPITPINNSQASTPMLAPAAPPVPMENSQAAPAPEASIAPSAPPASFDPSQNIIAAPSAAPDSQAQGDKNSQSPNGSVGMPGNPNPQPTPAVTLTSQVEAFIPEKVKQGDPRAILHTSMGDIVIRLFAYQAPITVHNFIDLARGDKESTDPKTGKQTRRPFYTNLTFHRAIPGVMVQTGCPFGTGRGGPGFTINDEISRSSTFDVAGMVAMAPERDPKAPMEYVKNTNGSQFFITLQPRKDWDGKFTVFGKVEKGLKIAEKISRVKTGPTDRPIKKVFLTQIEIIDEATADAIRTKKKSKATHDDDDDDDDSRD